MLPYGIRFAPGDITLPFRTAQVAHVVFDTPGSGAAKINPGLRMEQQVGVRGRQYGSVIERNARGTFVHGFLLICNMIMTHLR
jgi:hypothetical protein